MGWNEGKHIRTLRNKRASPSASTFVFTRILQAINKLVRCRTRSLAHGKTWLIARNLSDISACSFLSRYPSLACPSHYQTCLFSSCMPIFLLSSCNVQYDTSRGFSSAVHHPETNLFYLSSADASFVFLLLYLYVCVPRSTDEPLGSV